MFHKITDEYGPIPPTKPELNLRPFVAQEVPPVEVDDELDELFRIPLPGKITFAGSTIKLRKFTLFTSFNVLTFLADNRLDQSDPYDMNSALIMVRLVSSDLIISNDPTQPPTPPHNDAVGIDSMSMEEADAVVNSTRMSLGESFSKRMMNAVFCYTSQGTSDGELKWYESFTQVFGKIVSKRRFITICDLIIEAGSLQRYVDKVTVGHIKSIHSVLQRRLMSLATPELVLRALNMDLVYRMIDPNALGEYHRFYMEGVLAQIAAGPLKCYLRGPYDPTDENVSIPDGVMLVNVKPLRTPYHERLIKQAKIIFDVYGVSVGRWYQGEKATVFLDGQDLCFKEVVKAASDKKETLGETKESN